MGFPCLSHLGFGGCGCVDAMKFTMKGVSAWPRSFVSFMGTFLIILPRPRCMAATVNSSELVRNVNRMSEPFRDGFWRRHLDARERARSQDGSVPITKEKRRIRNIIKKVD